MRRPGKPATTGAGITRQYRKELAELAPHELQDKRGRDILLRYVKEHEATVSKDTLKKIYNESVEHAQFEVSRAGRQAAAETLLKSVKEKLDELRSKRIAGGKRNELLASLFTREGQCVIDKQVKSQRSIAYYLNVDMKAMSRARELAQKEPSHEKKKIVRQRIPESKISAFNAFVVDNGTPSAHLQVREGDDFKPVIVLHCAKQELFARYCATVPEEERVSRGSFFKMLSSKRFRSAKLLAGLCNLCDETGYQAMRVLNECVNKLQDERARRELTQRLQQWMAHLIQIFVRTECGRLCDAKRPCTETHCALFVLGDEQQLDLATRATHDDCADCLIALHTLEIIKTFVAQGMITLTASEEKRLARVPNMIRDFFSHRLRNSIVQRHFRTVRDNLAEGEMVIVFDFKQKVFPIYHRETQVQWFGKKACASIMGVLVHTKVNGQLCHHYYLGVAGDVKQDFFSAVTFLDAFVHHFQAQLRQAPKIFAFADNGKHYHNKIVTTLPLMFDHVYQVKVSALTFFEPGEGKSMLDGFFGTVGRELRRHSAANEIDIDTPAQVLEVLQQSVGHLATIASVSINREHVDREVQLDGKSTVGKRRRLTGSSNLRHVLFDHEQHEALLFANVLLADDTARVKVKFALPALLDDLRPLHAIGRAALMEQVNQRNMTSTAAATMPLRQHVSDAAAASSSGSSTESAAGSGENCTEVSAGLYKIVQSHAHAADTHPTDGQVADAQQRVELAADDLRGRAAVSAQRHRVHAKRQRTVTVERIAGVGLPILSERSDEMRDDDNQALERSEEGDESDGSTNLPSSILFHFGFALQKARKNARFDRQQLRLLEFAYQLGRIDGHQHESNATIVEAFERLIDAGLLNTEPLSERQIGAWLSRRAKARQSPTSTWFDPESPKLERVWDDEVEQEESPPPERVRDENEQDRNDDHDNGAVVEEQTREASVRAILQENDAVDDEQQDSEAAAPSSSLPALSSTKQQQQQQQQQQPQKRKSLSRMIAESAAAARAVATQQLLGGNAGRRRSSRQSRKRSAAAAFV